MTLRYHLTLSLRRNLFHEIDNSIKHVSLLLEVVLFLTGAYEDKLGILLSRSPFHLNECFNCEKLVEADHLIAG